MRKIIVLAALLIVALPIVAEEGRDELPPLRPDLVERLLSGIPGAVTLTVGAVPESLATDVSIPPGVTVDLTLQREQGDMILLTVPGTPETARETIEKELKKAGWKDAPDPQMVRGGFATALNLRGTGLCRDQQYLTIGLDRPRGGETPVSLRIGDAQGAFFCGAPQQRRLRQDEIELPYLVPPPGVRGRGSSMGGGGDQANSGLLVTTGLSVAELMAHYHPQMVEQGWASTAKLGDAEAALYRYERKDEEGRDWIGILTAVSSGDMERHLGLIVILDRK